MSFNFPYFRPPPGAEELRAEVREFIARERAEDRWRRQGDFAIHYDADFSRLIEGGWIGCNTTKEE